MKLKSTCRYRACASFLWVLLGVPPMLAAGNMPLSLPVTVSLNAILFFLYALCTFQKQTNLFIQLGVSRKKQYASFFALLPVCLLAALYMTALFWLCTQILIAFPDAFGDMDATVYTLYTQEWTLPRVLRSCLLLFLQNTAGLFIGYFAASLLYRRKRRIHAKLAKALTAAAVIILFCALIAGINRLYPVYAAQTSDSLLGNICRTWVSWMVFGRPVGDVTILNPLRDALLTVAFASADWLLLRDLPQQAS